MSQNHRSRFILCDLDDFLLAFHPICPDQLKGMQRDLTLSNKLYLRGWDNRQGELSERLRQLIKARYALRVGFAPSSKGIWLILEGEESVLEELRSALRMSPDEYRLLSQQEVIAVVTNHN